LGYANYKAQILVSYLILSIGSILCHSHLGQVRLDQEQEGYLKVLHFIAAKWTTLCLRTFQSAFSPSSIADILAGGFNEDEEHNVLLVRFQYATCTVKRFLEFALLFESYPWGFHKLLVKDENTVTSTLATMKEEWRFLMKLEAETPKLHQKWPVKQINQLRWYAYREVMTFCEERDFSAEPKVLEEIRELVRAWVPNPMSTLGCDKVFKELRSGETRHSTNKSTSVEQLQAVAVKAVNNRYADFEIVEPHASDVHSVTPNSFLKKAIFDSSRATGSETGLPRFNAWSKLSTPAPHFLTRRGLNLWLALKKADGSIQNFWAAQMVRSATVTYLKESLCVLPCFHHAL